MARAPGASVLSAEGGRYFTERPAAGGGASPVDGGPKAARLMSTERANPERLDLHVREMAVAISTRTCPHCYSRYFVIDSNARHRQAYLHAMQQRPSRTTMH